MSQVIPEPLAIGQHPLAALIKIVDLDNPPPFIRVLRKPEEFAEITDPSVENISAWLYPHDWGECSDIFDRRATRSWSDESGESYLESGTYKEDWPLSPAALRTLNYDKADIFKQEFARLARLAVKNMPGLSEVSMSLEFWRDNTNVDIHIDNDSCARMLLATEEGSTCLIDPVQLVAKNYPSDGEKFFRETDEEDLSLADVLGDGLDVYAAPLGAVTFIRADMMKPAKTISWHTGWPLLLEPDTKLAVRPRPLWSANFYAPS